MRRQILILLMGLSISIGTFGCTQKPDASAQSKNALGVEQAKPEKDDKEAEDLDAANDFENEKIQVYGTELNNGVYPITVKSSSSMFRVTEAELTVKNGVLSVLMTLSGTGYLRLYLGTGEQAAEASEEDYIYYTENSDGKYTYEVPVEALNQDTACAAWSIKKERWYDRVLVFQSESLPPEAFKTLESQTTAFADGKYYIDVSLAGGTGRTDITSPVILTVRNSEITARIEWNSPYYDYMIVNGNKYAPVSTEGNSSVFEILIGKLEKILPVKANTTAMSEPHEIAYTLSFDLDSLKLVDQNYE